jgi:PAS domain S-box-containing protein
MAKKKPNLVSQRDGSAKGSKPAAKKLTSKKNQIAPQRLLRELQVHQVELEMKNRELRETQQSLEESRNRYADLYDFAPIGYLTLDQKGVIREANLTAATLLGIQRSRLIGKPFFLFVADSDVGIFRSHLQQCQQSDHQIAIEVWLRPKDAVLLPVQLLSVPIRQDAQLSYRTTIIDMTGRRLAEKKLWESEQQYRLLFEQNPHPMWVYDPETLAFLVVNEAAVRHYGYSRGEFQAMTIKDIRPPEDVPALVQFINQKNRRRDNLPAINSSGNWRHRKKDGVIIDVEIISSKIVFQGKNAILVLANDITERKRAEEALRQSQQKYEALVNSVDGIVWEADAATFRFSFVSRKAERLLGYPVSYWLNEPKFWQSHIHPDDRESAVDFCVKAAKEQRDHELEYRMVAADGRIVWLHDYVTIVVENNHVMKLRGIMVDITARKQAEAALHDSEERYRQLLESVPDGIYRTTPEGKFLMANSALANMLGYQSVEELLKVDIPTAIYFSPQERTRAQERLRKKKRRPNIFRLKKKDGSEIWVEDSGHIQFDSQGNLLYYEGAVRDITERKQAEEALLLSEQRFRDLFDNAPDVYIIFDSAGAILDFNQRGLKKLGYTRKHVVGKSFLEIVHQDDEEKAAQLIKQIQKSLRPPRNIELRLLTKDGQPRWMSNEFSLVRSPAGELQTIRVVCRDITEKKQLEDGLARSQRLETAGRIAGQIAHDFNNLLTPLTAYPALIIQDLPKDHPVSGMILEMQAAAQKIAEINQQLLALGRRGHYSFAAVDLNELVERTLFALNLPKEIVIEKHLSADLFPISGGAAQLTRALTNLIINAKEAMQDIGVLTINTNNVYLDEPLKGYQSVERGEYVKLAISDTGPGIDPEALERIFEPFFSTKKMDRMRGSGLGLSVVHGIVEDHKGYITVETVLGRGATFSLFLPAARDLVFKEPENLAHWRGGSESILVIDDDATQRRVIDQILKRLGYAVTALASGEEAVAHLRRHPYELLIIDMVMDGIDGVETYRQILEFAPQQKAILLSGYAMTQRVQQALQMGAGTFVSKPVIFKELAHAVRNELDKNSN